MPKESVYTAAAYLRLSRDDGDIDGSIKSESDSISSQRELVCSYIKKQNDMQLYDIYIDDGYSGTNFDRPQFKRMMADIEAGDVNCVVVKDLSRFGRDYIEAGRLIQKAFPAYHVRFIAVTDNFDSLTADYNTRSLVLPVKNFINDSYCRDISCKVKSHQKIKREQGKFIGAFAMYGYCKTAEDKNKLCPDGYAADIVRKIFSWKLEGMSALAIAQKLNGLGVLSPMEYKKAHGEKFSTGFYTNASAKWSAVAVKRILTNEIYTGTMVQGKKEQVNYKVKKMVEKPKEEWVRVEGTHKAIVPKEDFELVQALLAVDTRAKAGSKCAHLFSGKLFCADCKEAMVRRVNRCKGASKVYFICPTRNKGQGCTRHSILEDGLKEAVFQTLQAQLHVFLNMSRQMEYIQGMEVDFEEIFRLEKEVERLNREQEKYQELRAGLYEDKQTGLITEEDFKNFGAIFCKQQEAAKASFEKQEAMVKQLFCNGILSGMELERMKGEIELEGLDRDALLSFIAKVEVYEGKRIYVEFWAREEFSEFL